MLTNEISVFENGTYDRPNAFLNKITFKDETYRTSPMLAIDLDINNNALVLFEGDSQLSPYPTFLVSKIGLLCTTDEQNPVSFEYIYVNETVGLVQLLEGELALEIQGKVFIISYIDSQLEIFEPSEAEPIHWEEISGLKWYGQSFVDRYIEDELFEVDEVSENTYYFSQVDGENEGLTREQLLTSLVFPFKAHTSMVAVTKHDGSIDMDAKPNLTPVISNLTEYSSNIELPILAPFDIIYFTVAPDGFVKSITQASRLAEDEEDEDAEDE